MFYPHTLLIDSISQDARRESVDDIKVDLDKNAAFIWISVELDTVLNKKLNEKKNQKEKALMPYHFLL